MNRTIFLSQSKNIQQQQLFDILPTDDIINSNLHIEQLPYNDILELNQILNQLQQIVLYQQQFQYKLSNELHELSTRTGQQETILKDYITQNTTSILHYLYFVYGSVQNEIIFMKVDQSQFQQLILCIFDYFLQTQAKSNSELVFLNIYTKYTQLIIINHQTQVNYSFQNYIESGICQILTTSSIQNTAFFEENANQSQILDLQENNIMILNNLLIDSDQQYLGKQIRNDTFEAIFSFFLSLKKHFEKAASLNPIFLKAFLQIQQYFSGNDYRSSNQKSIPIFRKQFNENAIQAKMSLFELLFVHNLRFQQQNNVISELIEVSASNSNLSQFSFYLEQDFLVLNCQMCEIKAPLDFLDFYFQIQSNNLVFVQFANLLEQILDRFENLNHRVQVQNKLIFIVQKRFFCSFSNYTNRNANRALLGMIQYSCVNCDVLVSFLEQAFYCNTQNVEILVELIFLVKKILNDYLKLEEILGFQHYSTFLSYFSNLVVNCQSDLTPSIMDDLCQICLNLQQQEFEVDCRIFQLNQILKQVMEDNQLLVDNKHYILEFNDFYS